MENRIFIMFMFILWVTVTCVAIYTLGVGSVEAGRAAVIVNIWLAAWMVKGTR